MDIFTTDYLRHTAEMAVMETLWQLHTLSVINSWWHLYTCVDRSLQWTHTVVSQKYTHPPFMLQVIVKVLLLIESTPT